MAAPARTLYALLCFLLINFWQLAVGLIAAGITGYGMHRFIPTNECWRGMFLLTGIVGAVAFVMAYIFLEESPRWLVSRQQIAKARENLEIVYGAHNSRFIEGELTNLNRQHRHVAEAACFDIQDLFLPCHRKPLLVTCALKFIQQFTGTAVIVSYMVVIFTGTGASREEALLFTALSSLPQLITMILGSYLLDLTGRKKLLIMSQAGIILTLLMMGLFQRFDGSLKTASMILGVIMFRVFYSLGMGPIPLVLASEILPFKVRGRGLAISTLLHSTLGFLLTAFFPLVKSLIGEAAIYFCFAVISLAGLQYIRRRVDETTNIRLEDLESMNQD